MTRLVLRTLSILGAGFAVLVGSATAAAAQLPIDPTATPVKNTGGWVYNMAQLITILGVLILLVVVVGYMRFAPRFQREEGVRTVKAERVRPGQEPPRRAVDLSQAVPVVVQPPAVPAPAGAPVAQAAPAGAPVAAAAAAPAPPAASPAAEAPSAPAVVPPEPAPSTEAPSAAPVAAAAAGPKKDVELDQETFDRVLAELLEKGTTRRVAEGQARRAAMIAARKKAGA